MKISGIYKIINKVNEKYYVGSSINIYKRWNQHKSNLNRNIHTNDHLQKSWNKYGKNNFEFVIVEEISEEQLLIVEQKYINECKNNSDISYNISNDAISPMKGRKHSEKTKLEYSKTRKGMKRSKEFCKMCSERKHTQETKDKLKFDRIGKDNPFYNKTHTLISKKKIRDNSIKGNKFALYANIIYSWYNKLTKEKISCTQYDLYTKYNLDRGNLSGVRNGKIPSCKGWRLNKSK